MNGAATRFQSYAWAALLVAGTTALAAAVRAALRLPDVEMLYLLAVTIAAVRLGRGPAIFTAVLGVAAYDFFLVPPYLTFVVRDTHHVLTFATMFVLGLLISELTARIRSQQSQAIEREREAARLAEQARAATLRAQTEEMRASLLAAVSHDLRTPLAAILGAATSLREHRELAPDTRTDLLETICEEADRLERLVANLLDMTRLSGAVTLKRDWVPLDEILGSALTRLDARLGDRPIQVNLPGSLPLLSVDPVLLEQLFVNLLENAAKYTPQGSPIEISARAGDDGRIAIDFGDRGRGLPEGSEEAVFQKFFRGAHTAVPGVGLGLPICRAIAEAHGGAIAAANRPGGGASFRVTLPLVGSAPSVPPELPEDERVREVPR